jgi:hypothetical protein
LLLTFNKQAAGQEICAAQPTGESGVNPELTRNRERPPPWSEAGKPGNASKNLVEERECGLNRLGGPLQKGFALKSKFISSLIGLGIGLLLAATPAVAAADPSTEPPADGAVQACTDSGQVWLVAVDDQGNQLASQCVGNPETGTAAIEAAGLNIVRDSSGFMCALGGYPAECPATFTGNFWAYYQTTPGNTWEFATTGQDDSVPAAGSIEGWCYSDGTPETCKLPDFSLTKQARDLPETDPSVSPVPISAEAPATAVPISAEAPATAEPISADAPVATNENDTTDEHGLTTGVIILIVLGAIVVIGGVAYLIVRARKSDTSA